MTVVEIVRVKCRAMIKVNKSRLKSVRRFEDRIVRCRVELKEVLGGWWFVK